MTVFFNFTSLIFTYLVLSDDLKVSFFFMYVSYFLFSFFLDICYFFCKVWIRSVSFFLMFFISSYSHNFLGLWIFACASISILRWIIEITFKITKIPIFFLFSHFGKINKDVSFFVFFRTTLKSFIALI